MTDKKHKRNRSKLLDHNIVREYLKKKNIHTLSQFEEEFVIYYKLKSAESSIPRKAWYGIKIDNSRALDIAHFLGVNHYTELMTFSTSMWWDELLGDNSKHDNTFEIDYTNEDDDDEWRNVNFGNLIPDNDQALEEVPINQNWQLQFLGEPEDTFAAFLQSDKKITQIAPLQAQGCECKIVQYTQSVAYPQHSPLAFDLTKGPGWRRFIVVRSKHLPIPPRDPRNTTITSLELELFARQMLDQKDNEVAVQSHEFTLVNESQ